MMLQRYPLPAIFGGYQIRNEQESRQSPRADEEYDLNWFAGLLCSARGVPYCSLIRTGLAGDPGVLLLIFVKYAVFDKDFV